MAKELQWNQSGLSNLSPHAIDIYPLFPNQSRCRDHAAPAASRRQGDCFEQWGCLVLFVENYCQSRTSSRARRLAFRYFFCETPRDFGLRTPNILGLQMKGCGYSTRLT